jgi:ferredoxin
MNCLTSQIGGAGGGGVRVVRLTMGKRSVADVRFTLVDGVSGERHSITAQEGISVHAAAKLAGRAADAIDAPCDGCVACGLCAVQVTGLKDAQTTLQEVGETERKLLDHFRFPKVPPTRLACNLILRADMEGMTVTTLQPPK